MIILDTDHFSALKYSQSQSNRRLIERIESSPDQDFATTVITLEEQMRGWLARIHRIHDIHDQVPAYARLANLFQSSMTGQYCRSIPEPQINSTSTENQKFASRQWI
ncbi:PIN domain-containing protein [Lacunimicrobium album]